MNSDAREWGATILRLWAGFISAYEGLTMLRGLGPLSYMELKSASLEAWISLAVAVILAAGGAAIFLGIAMRLAACLTALSAAYHLWGLVGTKILALHNYQLKTTILISCVALILIGPGRLNLGSAFRKRR